MIRNNLKLITTSEQARIMGSKGGKASTISKKTAARIREWKKKAKKEGSDGAVFDKWVNMLEDPDFMDTELIKSLEQLNAEMIKSGASYKDRMALLRMYQTFREHRHGKEIRHKGDPLMSVNLHETKIMNLFNEKIKPILSTMTTEQKIELMKEFEEDIPNKD